MTVEELINEVVARDLFDIKTDGTYVEQAQHLIEQCHPGATGMRMLEIAAEKSSAEIPYTMQNRALHGLMHGGCFFTVGDTMTALMGIYHIEDPKERTLTMSASIRYLRPIQKDTVRVEARLASKKGRQLDFVVDFLNDAGKRAAQAKYRYMLVAIRE